MPELGPSSAPTNAGEGKRGILLRVHPAPPEDVLEETSSVLFLLVTNRLCNRQHLILPAKQRTYFTGSGELGCQLRPGSGKHPAWTHHMDTSSTGKPGQRLPSHIRRCPVHLIPLPKSPPLILTSPSALSALILQRTCIGEMATEREKCGGEWAELRWETTHASTQVIRAIL